EDRVVAPRAFVVLARFHRPIMAAPHRPGEPHRTVVGIPFRGPARPIHPAAVWWVPERGVRPIPPVMRELMTHSGVGFSSVSRGRIPVLA
ncbi:MAG: hypothetical protein ABR925_09575, partial [Acidimicrobiales bacterium]